MSILKNLNTVQRQAVEKIDGPNLILAGAGSGKTRVLTHKIAFLIQRKKVNPENILAMTFTNKAANEMKDRVEALLDIPLKKMWIGTFHSLFARILRKNCEKLGYQSNFAIYDEADQIALIKNVITEKNFLSQAIDAKSLRSKIKFIKNANISPEHVKFSSASISDDIFYDIYSTYQNRLQQNNAMDFEDLLLRSIDLFKLFPTVLDYYQAKFHYILVDEYQDTNRLQYDLIKLLSQKHHNISVVGDDDQSIYRWRGADIKNILDFETDYPDCSIFRLEQNYRSTANILNIAHSIISHNRNRMEKELWTKKEPGEKVTFILTNDAIEEASAIIYKIEQEIQKNELNFSDFAVLYRTNAQSRAIEEVLKNRGINYVVVGGIRFYERKEIKDVLAYLRTLVNPNDGISIRRIINYPARGIGETTIKKIEQFSIDNNIPLFKAIEKIEEIESISLRTKNSINEFYSLIKKYLNLKHKGDVSITELVSTLIGELGILTILKQEGSLESLNKIDNIRELLNGINDFILRNPHLTLEIYLENVALITDVDNWDTRANAVSLLTLHSAKGLEFPVVFITGLEEGLFPLSRQMSTDEDLEEERRLFYVGATRAKEKLYLSSALNRRKFGENTSGTISRFLNEIDKTLLEIEETYQARHIHLSQHSHQPKRIFKFDHGDENEAIYKPGILVKHPTFGKGVVRTVEGDDANMVLNILFEEVGAKKIVLKYCKLEIIR
jgi:DNA helicase-2/ATP-dependent DNA helicase PcrA